MSPAINKTQRKARKPRVNAVHRQFFIDEAGRNKIHSASTDKTMVLWLQLQAEGGRKRKVGVVTKSTKTLVVKRKRSLHLFRNGNAYGFNEYILKNTKTFDTIRLSDEVHEWKVPVEFILKEGKHLNFKQQGFELQLFVTLEQLGPYRVYKKENRRL